MEDTKLGVDDLKSDQPSKLTYSVGSKSLDGSIISHIVGREADFIVFFCEDSALSWEHRKTPDWAYVGIAEYEKLNCKIPTYLGQIHKKEIKTRMAASLLLSFRSREHDKKNVLKYFDEAWQYVNNYESRDILFAGDGFYLYQDSDELLVLRSSTFESETGKAYTEASYLSQQAKHYFTGKKLNQANRLISNAFSNYEQFDSEDIFSEAKGFIEVQVNEAAKISYLSASIVVAFLTSATLIIMYYQFLFLTDGIKPIILCGLAGVIGSIISVLQRSNSIKPELYASVSLVIFQGVTRVFLGLVFGSLVPICANANIVLGFTDNNINALFLVALFAGINERFIPDLIERNITESGL